MMKLIRVLAVAAVAGLFHAAIAQQQIERPVISAYTLQAGTSHIAETYLSPLRHSGISLALDYERMQAMRFNPESWVMRLGGRLEGSRTLNNPARNAYMWNLNFRLGWGMMRKFRPFETLNVYAGGSTTADAGVFYLPRNSNNPAAAKASWTVNAIAGAAWNTKILRLPVCLRYMLELPLGGMFFSPEYGELYYEIYLGNHRGLLRGAWPGNFFRLTNLLSADLRFGRTIVRLGYRCEIQSAKASDIVTRHIGHWAVLGIASEWLSLPARGSRNFNDAKIISALY